MMLRFITVSAMIVALSGCGGGVVIKDATSTTKFTSSTDPFGKSKVVTVHDARINTKDTVIINNALKKQQEFVANNPEQVVTTESSTNSVAESSTPVHLDAHGNVREVSDTGTKAVATNTNTNTNSTTTPVQESRDDKVLPLFSLFFAMMVMGMLGAGIIGILEAISGRNSLSVEQALRTAPIPPVQKAKPRKKPKKKKQTPK